LVTVKIWVAVTRKKLLMGSMYIITRSSLRNFQSGGLVLQYFLEHSHLPTYTDELGVGVGVGAGVNMGWVGDGVNVGPVTAGCVGAGVDKGWRCSRPPKKARIAKTAKTTKAEMRGMKGGKRRITGRGAPQELQKRAPEGFKAPQYGQYITPPSKICLGL
jgi:hypothetical protein